MGPDPVFEPMGLRPIRRRDLRVLFEHHQDPVAQAMAACDPRGRTEFLDRWTQVLADPMSVARVIEVGGCVGGYVVSWIEPDGRRLVGYWMGRSFWGRGLATSALRLFLPEVTDRPLFAHVAVHNAASARVLQKCGFVASPTAFASQISEGVPEQVYWLAGARARRSDPPPHRV